MSAFHKFGASKTLCIENHPHPSRLEKAVCDLLRLREMAGEIRKGTRRWQHSLLLMDCEACGSRLNWKVDFSYEDATSLDLCFAEAKGKEDKEYRMKRNYWREHQPYRLEVWKGSWQRPKLVETIEAKARVGTE